jgi:hypothetical protein
LFAAATALVWLATLDHSPPVPVLSRGAEEGRSGKDEAEGRKRKTDEKGAPSLAEGRSLEPLYDVHPGLR